MLADRKPRVLFVCAGNAARSQMAEGFARRLGLDAASAGTEPATRVSHAAVEAMAERGIDISGHVPKRLDLARVGDYDRVVTMGCGVAESCPALHCDEDWGLDDPIGRPAEDVRQLRDEIEGRVAALATQLVPSRASP